MLNLHRITLIIIKGVSDLSIELWDIVPWVKSCKQNTNSKHHNYNEVSVRYALTSRSVSLNGFVSVKMHSSVLKKDIFTKHTVAFVSNHNVYDVAV